MSISDNNFNNQTTSDNIPPQTRTSPGKGEMFVGLNLLSKIGVIFIIIGAIAFTAVSEDYLSAAVRTIIVFALGLVMAGAGELFYRKDSAVFARALTLGAILELNISVMISFFGFESMGCTAAALSAVGVGMFSLLLAWRYNSQTVMACAVLFSAITFFVADDAASLVIVMLTATGVGLCACIIAERKNWQAVEYVGIACAFVLAFSSRIASEEFFEDVVAECFFGAIFTAVIFSVYMGIILARGLKNDGALVSMDMTKLISLGIICSAMTLFMTLEVSRQTAGVPVCVMVILYITAAALSCLKYGSCPLATGFECAALCSIPMSFPCFMSLRWASIALLVYGGALAIWGIAAERRLRKYWGYAALVISEFLFFIGLIASYEKPISLLHFALNAAVFLAIMILLAKKQTRGALFMPYCYAALFNVMFFLTYAAGTHLIPALGKALALEKGEQELFAVILKAALWLAGGFAAGKLSFMKKHANILSIMFYIFGMFWLLDVNIRTGISQNASAAAVVLSVVINVISVLAVLDIVKRAESAVGKATQSLALIVSAYSLLMITIVLGTNKWVAFTSCIISIIYIAVAVFWIVLGFIKAKPLTRRFGLALILLASAKLCFFDFPNIGEMGRTLLFIGFGITLLAVSFAYGYLENRARKK